MFIKLVISGNRSLYFVIDHKLHLSLVKLLTVGWGTGGGGRGTPTLPRTRAAGQPEAGPPTLPRLLILAITRDTEYVIEV